MNTTNLWCNYDVIRSIMSYCDPEDAASSRLVCSNFQNAINTPSFWISILKSQLIPRNFVNHELNIRHNLYGSPNLSDQEREIVNSALFTDQNMDHVKPSYVVRALCRLYYLWRTYNALYLIDEFNFPTNVSRELQDVLRTYNVKKSAVNWHVRWRLWVSSRNEDIEFKDGQLRILASFYHQTSTAANVPSVVLVLSNPASEELRKFIVEHGDLPGSNLPLIKLVQHFFTEHAKRHDRFVMPRFVQIQGSMNVNLLVQHNRLIQVDHLDIVECLDPQHDYSPLFELTSKTLAQSHVDTIIYNSISGIQVDPFDYTQRYCGRLVAYQATVLRMLDVGNGWEINAILNMGGLEDNIPKHVQNDDQPRGLYWFFNEIREAIFPSEGRSRTDYFIYRWKMAIWESRWIRKTKKETPQIQEITDDEEKRLYQVDPDVVKNKSVLIIHRDKKNSNKLEWPKALNRPSRFGTPLLRRYLIKPRDEVVLHGRLTADPRVIIAYDLSLLKPKLFLLTHRDWLRLALNGTIVGIAAYTLYVRHGDAIREGTLIQQISGSYVKALLKLQYVILLFNLYTFGPQAINYVLSAMLPMPKGLVPQWVKDLQDYIWMGLFVYWTGKNLVFIDTKNATFLQLKSREWLTSYGSYLAEAYGYIFAADCGLRTLPVLFKMQRRVLLYLRQKFSLFKSYLGTKVK
jgi:hypothetical protein